MFKEIINDICICKLSGKVDTLTAPDIERFVLGILEEGHKKIILDCKEMSYISSSGLRVFLIAQKKLKETNANLVIFGIQDSLQSIFQISGLNRFFHFADSIDDAEQYLNTH